MTRPELIIASALLIAFVVFMRWAMNTIGESWGLGALVMTVTGIAAIYLPIIYFVERRRGNLPRWLQPKANRPPPRG